MVQKIILLLADVWAIVCLAQMLLQWGGLRFDHPVAQFCKQTTDKIVRPLRKIIPPWRQWDAVCVVAAALVYYLAFWVMIRFSLPFVSLSKTVLAAAGLMALSLSKAVAYVLLLGLLARMVLSITRPEEPLLSVLQKIFRPLVQPFSVFRAGRYDFSGSVVALAAWLWLTGFLPLAMDAANGWLLQ